MTTGRNYYQLAAINMQSNFDSYVLQGI